MTLKEFYENNQDKMLKIVNYRRILEYFLIFLFMIAMTTIPIISLYIISIINGKISDNVAFIIGITPPVIFTLLFGFNIEFMGESLLKKKINKLFSYEELNLLNKNFASSTVPFEFLKLSLLEEDFTWIYCNLYGYKWDYNYNNLIEAISDSEHFIAFLEANEDYSRNKNSIAEEFNKKEILEIYNKLTLSKEKAKEILIQNKLL